MHYVQYYAKVIHGVTTRTKLQSALLIYNVLFIGRAGGVLLL